MTGTRLFQVFFFLLLTPVWLLAQEVRKQGSGLIGGNLIDPQRLPVAGATVQLSSSTTVSFKREQFSGANGNFQFEGLTFGVYRVQISAVGFSALTIDSILVRPERFDFNLSDIKLVRSVKDLGEVVVLAEKPLIQSKEGNILFNTAESALSAGSNASDLLKNAPLVAVDPDGRISVRGKEPKILIDDKPVELNAQQLQDFLESLPGSMIERIEVMTNPPPQYANEPGGVINIITKKGKVGRTARVQLYAGTRGESGGSANLNIRKQGFSVNFNAGYGYNLYQGYGYSRRQNFFGDSTSYLNIDNQYRNKNGRPNFRFNLDRDWKERHSLNLVIQYNESQQHNASAIQFLDMDGTKQATSLSIRDIGLSGHSQNPSMNFTYSHRGLREGELFRLIGSASYTNNQTGRNFYQQYLNTDQTPTGRDSTQTQDARTIVTGFSLRVAYDHPLANKKSFISTGGYFNYSSNDAELVTARYLGLGKGYTVIPYLSNDLLFLQQLSNIRTSFKHLFSKTASVSAGFNVEATRVHFDLYRDGNSTGNVYWNLLPFFNFNKSWEELLHLTVSYRRTIRRPGINELNPSVDYTDPYNWRFGTITLRPTIADNLDLILGRNRDNYYLNFGLGYNVVKDIFTQIRSLQPDGKTYVVWQNINDRIEYGASTWNGYTFSVKFRLNMNASYTYNRYSVADRLQLRYRNGGSFTSGVNASYQPASVWNINGGFTFNRFASPQGFVRWNSSMNIALQRKLFSRRLIITVTVIDPVQQQVNRTFTYGVNFRHESYSYTQTRNYRLTLSYNFLNVGRKPTREEEAEKDKLKQFMPIKK